MRIFESKMNLKSQSIITDQALTPNVTPNVDPKRFLDVTAFKLQFLTCILYIKERPNAFLIYLLCFIAIERLKIGS